MSETNLVKDNIGQIGQKDIRDKKTEKLTSALYLVTNFLSDSDPVKWKIRATALDILLAGDESASRRMSYIANLLKLIDVAFYDRGASPMNLSILRQEYLSLSNLLKQQNSVLDSVLETEALPPLPFSPPAKLKIKKASKSSMPSASKTDRQTVILDLLKTGVWLSIKDIAKNLPNFSAKTVQRELNALAIAGLIKKTGERRWSRYAKI